MTRTTATQIVIRALWTGVLLSVSASVAHAQVEPPPVAPPRQSHGLTLMPGVDVPLTTSVLAGSGTRTQGTQLSGSTRLQLTARFSPSETWFARVTGYYYLDSAQKRPWNPDFTYSFGYDSWRPGTFALTYDNYGGNRWNPDTAGGEKVTRFDEGSVTASYKIPMPTALESLFSPDGESHWSASVAIHVTPRFPREGADERGSWKRAVSVGVRSRFYRRLYAEGRVFLYPSSEQQQPWDPDFTYGFGWFDWRPGTLSIQYGNYSGNRWPGQSSTGTGAFRHGSLTAFLTTTW